MFHKGKHNREKQLRFSIRKVSFGAASVAVAALFMFLGNGAVSAAEQGVSSTNGETQAPQPKDQNVQNGTYEGNTVAISPAATVETNTQPSTVENSSSPESAPQKVETLDKKELTDLIKEIDGKLSQGTYASKTDNSVNQLKTALDEAKSVLNKAKTQAELSQAQAKLVTATTKLQTKPEEKKEAPAVDTTNGKATVGKKATNTEKSSESNSIANSGSKDERNGKILDTNNPFRTDTTPSTTDDTSANQTYTAPAADANLEKLSEKLRELPDYIENNKKVQDMDTLGDAKGLAAGSVTEINEFGGWKAVNQEDGSPGKFAIAKKTEKGVFPLETVNVVGARKTAWVEEQSFNRDKKYMLFLSEVRTQDTQNKDSYESKPYHSAQEDVKGKIVSIGVKGYKGIEKRFKVYHSQEETKVNIQFKTGYSGIMEGDGEKSRAKYKVEVFSEVNGLESLVYSTEFDPGVNVDDEKQTVVAAENGKPAKGSLDVTTADAALEELSQDKYKPLGTGGSFTSKGITLPKGANSYKVRISSANDRYLGMDYHSRFAQYALPITGQGFNINQDTQNVAKDLLQRIYNKLIKQKLEDTKWSTPETKGAYETKLTEINNLLSSKISTTSNYKESAKSLIEKYNSLNNRDTIIAAAKADLEKAVQAEKAAIAADNSLTTEQRKEKEKAVDAAKTAEEAKITAAENADKVAEAKTAGVTAIKGVHTPGTSSSDSEGNVIVPPTVEVPAYTDPVGTSSTDGEGNVIVPPTAEVPAYTDPVGTSSTDGAGNLITPPTVEVPAYTDPVGTSSTDGAGNLITPPTAEVPAYTDPVGTSSADGSGNVITPPTLEVPAYTDPVGTSSTDGDGNVITPPTVEVPAYTDPVGTSSTDGEGNVITPPTVEVPAYTDPVGTSNTDGDGNVITPPTVEVPAYTDPVGTSSTDGAGNVITPPTAEVPAYTEPVGTSSTAGDGNVVTPPTAEVPAYTGSVNGISEEMPAQPNKDGSANEMSEGTPKSETTINKDRQLPNTGTADSTVAMVAAAASAVLGLGLAGRRRKEDEEA